MSVQQRELLLSDDMTDVASHLQNLKLGSSCKEWLKQIEKLNIVMREVEDLKKEEDTISNQVDTLRATLNNQIHTMTMLKNAKLSKAMSDTSELLKMYILEIEGSLSEVKGTKELKLSALQKMRNDIQENYRI